jgi:hypothetical protein
METSKTSTGETCNDLTLFAVDTPANHLAPQANAEAQTTQDTFGHGLEMPLAHYNLPTQSWRTSEDTSLWGDYKSLENLPKSGMTRSGALFLQPDWVRPIDETELLSWPTPTARDWKGAAGFKNPKRNLADLTYLAQIRDGHRLAEYPTMSANGMGNTGSQQILQRKVESGQMTEQEKKRMTAGNGGSLNPMWVEWLMGFPIGWTDLED